MKTEMHLSFPRLGLLVSAFAVFAASPAWTQVPVDESGQPLDAVEEISPDSSAPADEVPVYTDEELEALVGPIALYPDDLLAIVLPASTYPLEIVQAARFLEELETDSGLKPDESWDDSVVALLNYPEVVEMMNEDIDWTWKLGEAVVAQQPDVIAAIERFRDRAYAAGNLKSDGYQTVERTDDGAIEIDTVEDEVIYVPYYEPERVVVYQPRPVYYYYPQAYPVYYYPYPAHYSFASGYFWGVTTAFRVGWSSHHLHVFHHTYWGHPYYGRQYFGHWYRQPSISIFNSYYVNDHLRRSRHHHRDGDFWRPRRIGGPRPGHYRERVARYREPRLERTREGFRDGRSAGTRQIARDSDLARRLNDRGGEAARTGTASSATERRGFAASRDRAARRAGSGDSDAAIRFRPRQRTGEESRAVTTPRSASRRAVENRGAVRSSQATPADRGNAVRDRDRSSDVSRRANPPARTSRPPAARGTPRVTAPRSASSPRLSAPRSSSSRTARPSSPPRSSAPRASAPRSAPRASSPRSSAPRASAPRSSAPRASSPRSSAPRASSSRSSAPRASSPRSSAPRASSSRSSAPRASSARSSAPRASAPRQASRPAPARQSRAAPSRRSSGARVREH